MTRRKQRNSIPILPQFTSIGDDYLNGIGRNECNREGVQVGKFLASDFLANLNAFKSTTLDEICTRILKKLGEELTIVLKESWRNKIVHPKKVNTFRAS